MCLFSLKYVTLYVVNNFWPTSFVYLKFWRYVIFNIILNYSYFILIYSIPIDHSTMSTNPSTIKKWPLFLAITLHCDIKTSAPYSMQMPHRVWRVLDEACVLFHSMHTFFWNDNMCTSCAHWEWGRMHDALHWYYCILKPMHWKNLGMLVQSSRGR